MAIPLSYNIRSLQQRPGATLMTAAGIAVSVAVAILVMGLLAGLSRTFARTGDPLNLLVLREGAESELTSFISHDQLHVLQTLPGIAVGSDRRPIAIGEIVVAVVLPRTDSSDEANVTFRGTTQNVEEFRKDVRLAAGRWFADGNQEVVVSRTTAIRFKNCQIGDELQLGKSRWKVVGIFDAGASAYDSEIWADMNQVGQAFDRTTGVSSAWLRGDSLRDIDLLRHAVSADQRLRLTGMTEFAYFAQQTKSGVPIRFVGLLVATIMAIGAAFGAMNTMYAAVSNRGHEIATLRVLGFSRSAVLSSFVAESILLSLIGAVIGVAITLPLNGMNAATSNSVTFSQVNFRVSITPAVILGGVGFALATGILGGLAPAIHAARQHIASALRA